MYNKRFKLASHWAELEESCQNICLKEIDFRDLMVITKGWNPTRKTDPDRAYSDSIRLTRSRPNKLSSGFKPFRNQHISGQESPFFTIPGIFHEKPRIQGQKQDHLQPEEEGVRPSDPEAVEFGERSAQEPEVVVNKSRISSPINRNITPTQIDHNVVTPESNLNSDALWLQMSQFSEKTQKQFAELQASHERMKTLTASIDKTVKTLQDGHAQLRKVSEETKKLLNIVFEEQNHSKRYRDCLDKDINKQFTVYHNLKPQPQGHVMDNPYHQYDIKPDAMLLNKKRSPSQYQDGDNMSYSEKEALKQLPEAPSWPKFSGTGEYNHMELIDYIDGLLMDVPRVPDYWITARLNTALKGHVSIWYTQMKKIHARRRWPWWKIQIIQNHSNHTWIWKKTMSFENDKYSVDKDPYEWCLRQSKILKANDSQMNIQMGNHKLLTQMPGELEHAVKFRCNHNCTLDEIANTLQDVRNRTNIGKYTPHKSSGFKEEQPFRVEFKAKPRERVAEVAKKKIFFFTTVEESPTEDSDSDSMGDAIRKQSDDDQDPREEFPVEYQEDTTLEIQDIQLEAGMPQDTANKNLCKHTQGAQTFRVTPTKGMAYIHGTATKMTVCIDNAKHPLIIDSGAHCSKVARKYLDDHSPKWENQLLPTKAKNFKSASGKMTSIGTIIKEIIIPHRKGDIRLNPEFLVLDDGHIQGFLMGKDYQRMYDIDIYNSKNRHITIGTNKEKRFSFDIYHVSAQDQLEELLNEFRDGQVSTTLTSEQKLTFLKMLRNNRPAFSISEEQLGKSRGHDIELYLDVERPYPPILRSPPYPASLETRK
ncbi:hypothetical protein O181_021564 [Austropuccinia psidii MF-1]|uniref:Uncharacterized protein n=1 Tax=Austropuccinia psidii MF-1 TaxID=1389203 RepID=A0A9Q3CDA1_9BASI|nr:hypothetical protein [Austropuccinia psidii MF-1]